MIKKSDMIIMNIGKGYNIEITKEMVENSMDSFSYKPVIINYKQELQDYTDDVAVEEFAKRKVIGIIKSVRVVDKDVVAEVRWINEDYIREKYDNWCINLNDDKKSFEFGHVEVFE